MFLRIREVIKTGKEENEIIAISELEETIKKLIDFNSSKSEIMTPSSIYVSFEKVENGFKGERNVDFFHQILDSEAPRSGDEVEYGNGPHKPRGVRMIQKGNLSYSGITFRDLIDKISGEQPYKKELQSIIGCYGFWDKPIRQVGGRFQGGGNLTPEIISFSPGTYKDHVEPWYELVFKSSPNSYQFNINKIVSNGAEDISLWQREIQKDNSLENFQYFLKEIFIEQGTESCVVETTLGRGEGIAFTPNSNELLKILNELAFYTLLTETPYLDLVNEAMSLISSKPQCTIEGKIIVIYLEKGQFVERKQIRVSPLIFDEKVNSENKAYGLLTLETTQKIIGGLNEFVQSVRGKYQINKGLGL